MFGHTMVEVFPTIIYSCMLGMTGFALLDVLKRPREKQTLYLGALLLLLTIHLAGELFIYSGAYVYAPALAGAQFPFRVLLGPALFFYAHATMSPNATVEKKYWWLALSGPVLVIVAMLPFVLTLSSAEKLALAEPETRDPELWKIALATCLTATSIFIVFTLAFLAMAFRLHKTHVAQLMERFSEIEQRSLSWFKSVLFVWGAVWLLFAVEFALGALIGRWAGTGVLLPLCEAIALAFFIQKALAQKVLSASEKGQPSTETKRSALLSVQRMARIGKKLELAMSQDSLYLEDNLSLNSLSLAIDESENHISETLSQYLNTNFFQFVNGYRIEAAKRALVESNDLVTNIALDVGFNSKSTFNTAFKKMVGHTPSAYRNLVADSKQAS